MNVAALFDVHGMPWALEAVLAEAQDEADAIVFGGDFTYGPYPREALERVRALDAVVIRGNCERAPVEWELSKLDAEQVAWMQALPMTAELDGVLFCHATPNDDLPPTTAATPDEIVARQFAGVSGTVVIGHTHHQFDRHVGDLRVVNAGSVGMPHEDDVAAYWTLLVDGEPEFRRTGYDVEHAVREVRASGWPNTEAHLADKILAPTSRDAHIARIEAHRKAV
jgi:putative phosphoesterase